MPRARLASQARRCRKPNFSSFELRKFQSPIRVLHDFEQRSCTQPVARRKGRQQGWCRDGQSGLCRIRDNPDKSSTHKADDGHARPSRHPGWKSHAHLASLAECRGRVHCEADATPDEACDLRSLAECEAQLAVPTWSRTAVKPRLSSGQQIRDVTSPRAREGCRRRFHPDRSNPVTIRIWVATRC